MKLILVRHGETDWNKTGKLMSKTDIELNDFGLKQAIKTSEKLKTSKFDIIYSSPKKRALKTAEIINKYHNVNIKISNLLEERDFGDFEGSNYHKLNLIEIKENNLYEKYNMESPKNFEKRITSFLNNEFCKKYNKTILIVSHSGSIKMILYHLLKIKDSFEIFRKENIKPNASISTIEFDSNFNIISYNIADMKHLE